MVQQIIANLLPYSYRTKDGAEIDLVLVRGNVPIAAVEIKMFATPL